ncbi:glycosyltransferase [Paenibacillus sp. HB172176]|uniref:glycosyltransferase family protein n=1 Tax=Paenibacillus sp. HB172176 TaxID=2493690 RepID=UPI001F113EEA|nr:glycosyltransferase [Paenibacillus sp. HB172176]
MEKPLKLLILAKRFADTMPKHQHKFDMLTAIEQAADVSYWHRDGDILEILNGLDFEPDAIFHYDIEWRNAFAPQIRNLDKCKLLKACFVLDVHFEPDTRLRYFNRDAKPDMIFSASKYPFLNAFQECASRFHWLPFGINPSVIRDYREEKSIRYSLTGLLEEKYPFRQAVLNRMKGVDGFVHFKHPGHRTASRPGLFVNENYTRAINRSRISFTCGSVLQIPVAKFFEIPGCRSLMLAETNPDIEELGFKDEEHFIACDRSDFYEKALRYDADEEARASLTDKGYAFIQSKHTNEIRAAAFIDAVRKELSLRA